MSRWATEDGRRSRTGERGISRLPESGRSTRRDSRVPDPWDGGQVLLHVRPPRSRRRPHHHGDDGLAERRARAPTPATAALKSPLTMRSGTSRGKEVRMRRRRTPPALEIVTIRPTGLAPRPAERSPRPVPLRTGGRSGLLGVSPGPDDLSRRDQRETRPERQVGRKNAGRHAARLERRSEILRLGRRAEMDMPSATEAPVPALIAPDCSQEIDLAERGPLDITEIELTIGTLPQHEAEWH